MSTPTLDRAVEAAIDALEGSAAHRVTVSLVGEPHVYSIGVTPAVVVDLGGAVRAAIASLRNPDEALCDAISDSTPFPAQCMDDLVTYVLRQDDGEQADTAAGVLEQLIAWYEREVYAAREGRGQDDKALAEIIRAARAAVRV